MIMVRKIAFLLMLTACLLVSPLLRNEVNAYSPSRYFVYVENQTSENLIIYLFNKLHSVVRSGEKSSGIDVYPYNSMRIDLKNASDQIVYSVNVSKEEVSQKDLSLVIPEDTPVTPVDKTGMREYPLRIANLGEAQILALINGIPIEVIESFRAKSTSAFLKVGPEGNESKQLIESRDSSGKIVYSRTLSITEIRQNNMTVTAAPAAPSAFSLNIENFTGESLNIAVNGELVGTVSAGDKKASKN